MKEKVRVYSSKPHIYKLTDLRNGKIYIGQHNGKRRNYFTGGVIPRKIIKKHGVKVFKREIIIEGDRLTQDMLNELEIKYIKKYDAKNRKIGYNRTDGGMSNSGLIHSDEAKRKMSISQTGKKRSKETRKKLSIIAKNRPEELKIRNYESLKNFQFTEEIKLKMSESAKKRERHSEETKKKIGLSHLGKKRSKQACINISNSQKGKKLSKEHKKKISQSHLGKNGIPHSEETKKKISDTKKKASKIKCPFCKKETNKGNFLRWHGDNCKMKI